MRFKYGNKKTICAGLHKHDSKKEAARCDELYLIEKTGRIRDLEIHPRFELRVEKKKVCTYIADFCYVEEYNLGLTRYVVEDVKGVKTAVYRLKKKLMKILKGIDIRET